MKLETSPQAGAGQIGIFPLEGNQPSIIFTSFNGGAHCCTSALILAAGENGIRQYEMESFDGDGLSLRDVDNDGAFEIVTADQRFLYVFGPYATSLPPLKILKLTTDEVRDATLESRFRAFLRDDLIKTLHFVERSGGELEPNAVAGILARAAQAGLYHSVRAFFPSNILSSNWDLSCEPPECNPGKKFGSLQEAVDFRFSRWGYNQKSHLGPEASRFFSNLASHEKGFGLDGSEIGCKEEPATFTIVDSGYYAELAGYEYGCRFEQARVLANSATALGFCYGEGDMWFEQYHFERASDALYVSQWTHDIAESGDEYKATKLTVCK